MVARKVAPLFFTAAWLFAGTAGATGTFPGAIQRDLSLSYSPPCDLCHSGGITANGTVGTPFGKAMKARGLVAFDETALQSALDQMTQEKVDSDHDGVSDIDELRAGTDPNVPGAGSGIEPPTYGCAASHRGGTGCASWLAACVAVLVLGRRVRRRRGTA